MTGVLYARRAVAVLFLIVFGIQVIVVGARIVIVSFGVIALAVCIQVLFRMQPRLRGWNRTPIVSFLMWTLLLSAFVVQAWMTGPRSESFVSQLTGVMGMASVLAIGLWIAMACGAVVTTVRLSIVIVGYLRRHVNPTALRLAVIVMVFGLGPGGMAFGIVERDAAWIIGGGASMALIPAISILFLTRSWTDRNAVVMAGVCIELCLFTFSLSLAMSDSSRIGRGVQAIGVFPPVLLFLVLAADHLLRFGKPIKHLASRLGSQVAWVLIYLGVVVLILSALIFLMNHPSGVTGRISQHWQQAFAALTFGTMLVTGPVYLVWVVCRRSNWWAGSTAPE